MRLLSIIIPAYNEEKRLPKTLKLIGAYLKKRRIKNEIIVVDDGSTDATVKAASSVRGIKVRVLKNRVNSGKGFSINHGMLKARGDVLLFTDADLSTPVHFFDDFKKLHAAGIDIVIASRAVKGAVKKVKQPLYRDLMGRFFNVLVKLITGLGLNDTQCGFKSYTKKAAKAIFSRQTIFDFGFDAEVLYIAKIHGFKIKESPVDWYDSPATKVKAVRDSVRMLLGLFRVRWNDMIGKYK